MEALGRMGVRLTSSAGVGAPPIAEFVIGRILEVWKRTRELEVHQQAKRWEFTQGRLLMGSTIGIVGLGAIGSEIAKRAKAFGTTVLGTRRSYRPGMTADNVDELFGPGPEALAELLRRSDVVVLSAPATVETTDLIGAAELAAMKPGAVLVNVARGPLVDEGALIASLNDGHLGAAILDVTRTEPLPSDDPLWDAPRLYLSPHCSTSQDGYNDRLLDLYADNLVRYLADEPLKNLVTG
jgi:phosphoglycerate dehydrogenase-like enzyme